MPRAHTHGYTTSIWSPYGWAWLAENLQTPFSKILDPPLGWMGGRPVERLEVCEAKFFGWKRFSRFAAPYMHGLVCVAGGGCFIADTVFLTEL